MAAIIGLFLCLAPLFAITIRGWSNSILILGAFFCLVFLGMDKGRKIESKDQASQSLALIIFAFSLPVLAVAISSTIRGSFHPPEFDSPIRFFLAIPVFIFAYRTKTNAAKLLQFTIPGALLIILGQQYITSEPMHWGPDRMATYFADPLVFGYFSLTFSLICLASINLLKPDRPWVIAVKVLCVFIGFYLSIKSGSRTGWLAMPIVLGFLLYQRKNNRKPVHVFGSLGLIFLAVIIVYLLSSTVNSRINLAANEIISYQWTGIAPDTSVGLRITFLRIAWDLFFQSPWVGFGDTRFELTSIPFKIHSYASQTALDTALKSGFHNEIVTNAIRSGIFGLLSAIFLFAAPFIIFFKNLKSENKSNKANAIVGISFVLCMFISSLSTEILDLKYTASFYALMIALLCGSTITHHEQK